MWHTLQVIASIFGAVAAAIAGVIYVWTVYKGQTKPNRISWFGWSLASVLGVWAAFEGGAGIGAMAVAVAAGVQVVVFGLSLFPKYGKPGAERRFDYVVALVAAAGILAWRFAHFSPGVAVTIAIVADLWFVWLIVRESWYQPHTEAIAPWMIAVASSALGVVALQSLDYAAFAFPVYVLLADGIIAGVIAIRQNQIHASK